jgi:hypothetical protein
MDTVVQNEDHYAAFKNSRHSNYKQGVANSLGVFEATGLFEKTRLCNAIIACIFT